MKSIEELRKIGGELEDKLRLKSFPLAIKLVKNKEEIPENSKRPLKDFGCHLSLCQCFQMSRRDGETITALKEDMWCPEPVIGFGLEKPPKYFMEGNNRYPHDVETKEAGEKFAEQLPKLEPNKYIGITSTPLEQTEYIPDLVTIYCDSAQMVLLLMGREFKDGSNLTCDLCGHAACVYGLVPAIKEKKCQVAIPCRGDHYYATAEDGELMFTVPQEKINDFMAGLRHIEKTGSKMPQGRAMPPEYPLPANYDELVQKMDYIKNGETEKGKKVIGTKFSEKD